MVDRFMAKSVHTWTLPGYRRELDVMTTEQQDNCTDQHRARITGAASRASTRQGSRRLPGTPSAASERDGPTPGPPAVTRLPERGDSWSGVGSRGTRRGELPAEGARSRRRGDLSDLSGTLRGGGDGDACRGTEWPSAPTPAVVESTGACDSRRTSSESAPEEIPSTSTQSFHSLGPLDETQCQCICLHVTFRPASAAIDTSRTCATGPVTVGPASGPGQDRLTLAGGCSGKCEPAALAAEAALIGGGRSSVRGRSGSAGAGTGGEAVAGGSSTGSRCAASRSRATSSQ